MDSRTERDAYAYTGMDSAVLPPQDLESELIDLTGCSIRALRSWDRESLTPSLIRLLRQVYRPRGNFGGADPPDRVD
jgi:hypothetical protein